jgi:hypothetical protein
MASARGQTAHHLLVIDEAQDQDGPHIEAVFTPMRAANNATAVYIGTVKLTTDFLWTKKLELERETGGDAVRRVFLVKPEQVTAEVAAYQSFLDAQIRKHGRHHPIVASEYFLEPIDGAGGLFPPRRRALMHGQHPRLQGPQAGELYVATLDVAGEDEAATDPIARLAHPGRDYTVGTIFRVRWPPLGTYSPGPTYEAIDVFVDHGSKHFDATAVGAHGGAPTGAPLVHRLAAWLEHWQVAHLVADASGVGQGLVSWLAAALGSHRVTGFDFSGRGRKARLGSMFLSLVETGRFKYWGYDPVLGESPECASTGDSPVRVAFSDAAWFWRQVEACTYEVPPDGQFDRDLRWEVPASHRTPVPGGRPVPTHDDRLLSVAMIAELDRLVRECRIALGSAESAIIRPRDPLTDLHY